jgi:hypothetical protein
MQLDAKFLRVLHVDIDDQDSAHAEESLDGVGCREEDRIFDALLPLEL